MSKDCSAIAIPPRPERAVGSSDVDDSGEWRDSGGLAGRVDKLDVIEIPRKFPENRVFGGKNEKSFSFCISLA
ncbi:hypothetical protein [Brucella anthropi]|uniref:hypothetical protein n=1 Tax=Brucella anthropi TaxID=529 RepID=UPI003986AC84